MHIPFSGAHLDTVTERGCVAETSRRDHANSDPGSLFTSRCLLHPLRLALGAHSRACHRVGFGSSGKRRTERQEEWNTVCACEPVALQILPSWMGGRVVQGA